MAMLDLSVFILAAGNSVRWTGNNPKQLVDIGGVPLIARTVKQVRDLYGIEPYIVTTNGSVAMPGYQIHIPREHSLIVETLHSTVDLWTPKVVVLLGDTYYTDLVLAGILRNKEKVMFFGRLLEIYALSFTAHSAMIRSLTHVIFEAHTPGAKNVNRGKLWHLWYVFNNYPTDRHTMPNVDNRFFRQVKPDDITMDIDTWDDYVKLMETIGAQVSEKV